MSTAVAPGAGTRNTLHAALFEPSRVALVGASRDPIKASSRPLQFLRTADYPIRVSVVNRHGMEIDGAPVHRTVLEIPETPDHVFVMTPTSAVLETIEHCAQRGVRVATILSGGFAEDGPAGAALQQRVVDVARDGGVRLLGPNSLGLVNLHRALRLTGNAVFSDTALPVGGTFVASQSGSLIGALVSRGAAKGLGFSSVVSVGSEADLSIGEICSLTLDDDLVTGYALFLETIRHAEELAGFAREAASRGKPVVAYKLGESELAARLALSHTGALAGEDDVANAFLQEHGIARVRTLDGLMEAQELASRVGPRTAGDPQPRVAVVATTGGGAAMLVDQLSLRGVDVAQPSEDTYARLEDRGVTVARSPIVDLTLGGTRYEVMKAALEVLLEAPEFDLVMAAVGSSARTRPDLAVAPIIDSASATRPFAAFLVPEAPEATRLLRAAGVPAFTSPETCADVVAAVTGRRAPHPRDFRSVGPGGLILDESASYRRLASVGISCASFVELSVAEAATAVELPFPFPVAVKVLAQGVGHKSDLGGVVLGVSNPDELHAAVLQIRDRCAQQGLRVDRVLVQQMVAGIGEFLVGYRVDPEVGPLILLAAGGTNAELYRDRSIRLAPVTPETAREMLAEVTAVRAIEGFRKAGLGDRAALETALVALSRLAADADVAEAEINPLIVHGAGEGATAVDAVVTVAAS